MKLIKFPGYLWFSPHVFAAILLLLLWHSPAFAQPLLNQLKSSFSPYLAIHGDDPVAWQEWNSATLELARTQNKLLFVSIGYFSCHWCHVMQAESYRNAEIAALINQGFIPVKVDRELEVALDAEMLAFAQRTLGSAGWPLNVFITPEGYPLYVTLYDKPDRFRARLTSLSKEWQAASTGLKAIAQKSVQAQQPIKKIELSPDLADQYRKQLVEETLAQADLLAGGLSVPRKFPISPQLSALLEIEARQHDARLAEWLRLTLEQMAGGGLHDHVAGGFFRYTVDPLWQRPHFEKMLYDNAQLAMVYLRAAKILNEPAYRDIARETLDFMLAEMRVGAGFISSISALDEAGNEGGTYLWNEAQLKSVLQHDEYQLLAKVWGMDTASEFDAGYLPLNSKNPALDEQKILQQIYRKLLQVRKERSAPKDSKLMAGLNGIVLAAFSEAAGLDPRYRKAADELRAFLLGSMWQNGTLHKGMSNQQLLGPGDLEAYAYTASGLMRYAQLSGNAADVQTATQIARSAWQKFHTPHGFLLEQGSELARPFYQAVIADGPLPSPSSVLIVTSLQTGDRKLRGKAHDALAESEALQRQGVFWFASQVIALNRFFDMRSRR